MSGPFQKAMQEGTALAEGGSLSKAAEVFGRAAGPAEPDDAAIALEAQAQCYLELDKYREAAGAALRATRLRPSWAPAFATLGRTYLNGGALQEAVEILQQALQLARATARESKSEKDEELVEELQQDVAEAKKNLETHLATDHDVLLPMPIGEVWSGNDQLRIRQNVDCGCCNSVGEGPGGSIWAAGAALAQHILLPSDQRRIKALPSTWKGLNVLELGSGTGIAGLAAAAQGANALLTDRQPSLPLMEQNAKLNTSIVERGGGHVSAAVFDWLAPPPKEVQERFWDLIIAADLIYAFAAVDPFAQALDTILGLGGSSPVPVDDDETGQPQKRQKASEQHRQATRVFYAHTSRSDDLDVQMNRRLAEKGLMMQSLGRPSGRPVGAINQVVLDRVELFEISRCKREGGC